MRLMSGFYILSVVLEWFNLKCVALFWHAVSSIQRWNSVQHTFSGSNLETGLDLNLDIFDSAFAFILHLFGYLQTKFINY